MPRERITPLSIALTILAVPIRPTCIITPIPGVVIGGLPVASWTATERPRIVIVSVSGSEGGLPPVVVANAVVGAATVPAIRCVYVPLLIARVVVARVKMSI
jgi:hypothetical protein